MASIIDDEHVIQQPRSNTNPTDQYRVVKFGDWHNAMFGDGTLLPRMRKISSAKVQARW